MLKGKTLSLISKVIAIFTVIIGLFFSSRPAPELISIGFFIGSIFIPVDISKVIKNCKKNE